ncbi:MAG: MDR family MFS transporter [Tumebacillaceae bacterium]
MIHTSLHAYYNRYPLTVWVRLYGELLTRLTSSMVAPFMMLYLHDKLGGSVLLPMAVVGLQPLSDIVTTLLAGGVTDRIGRKPVIVGSLGLQMLAMAGMIFASTPLMFALLYICNGVGRSFYIPAERAQIADTVPDHQRGEVFALLSTVSSIGVTIGPLIGFTIYRYNPSISFALLSGALLIYLITVWWKVPETAPPTSRVQLSTDVQAKAIHANTAQATQELLTAQKPPYRILLSLMVLSLPISLFYALVETNFPLHVENNFADYLSILSWLSTTKGILLICTQVLLVKRTEHIKMNKLIFIAYVSYAVVALSYGFSHSFALLLLTQAVFTVADCYGITLVLKYVSLLAPPTLRGRCFSLYGMHWDISRTLGPYAGGLLFLHIGGAKLFGLIALLLLLGGVAQSVLIKRIDQQQTAAQPTSLQI